MARKASDARDAGVISCSNHADGTVEGYVVLRSADERLLGRRGLPLTRLYPRTRTERPQNKGDFPSTRGTLRQVEFKIRNGNIYFQLSLEPAAIGIYVAPWFEL